MTPTPGAPHLPRFLLAPQGSRWPLALLLLVLLTQSALAVPAASAAPAPEPAQPSTAVFQDHEGGRNLTAAYDALYQRPADPAALAALRARLSGHRVLLVPGFLTGLYMEIGQLVKRVSGKDDVMDYLQEQQEALRELGLPPEQPLLDKAVFNTQDSVAENARRIARAVQTLARSGQRVILLSHSKGGNDVLSALLLMQRQGRLRGVAGWISLQASFAGSPLATEAMGRPALRAALKLFLGRRGGSLAGLGDTAEAPSQRLLAANARAIRLLERRVPILCFASWKPAPTDPSQGIDSVLAKTRDLMDRRGMKNDGLVPTRSAILPGCDYIAKADIDHSETAMTNHPPAPPSTLDRRRMTQVLLALLLKGSE